MANAEIRWRAPEFEHREKSVAWFWLSIIVAAIILGMAVWQKNFLFGFFIIVAEILFISWGNKEPRELDFVLTNAKLQIADAEYPFTGMENFSLEDSPEKRWYNLFFHFKNHLKPPIKIAVPKDKSTEIKKFLAPILKQIEHKPSMLDALEEFIGF